MKAPAFQFYPDSFLLGTALFSCEETGAYIRLLCYQWDAGYLPDDNEKLANLARCGGNAVASIRHKFRICEDGFLRNDRLEKERQKQVDYRAKQAGNAAKRWVGNAKPDAVAMPSYIPTHMPNVCFPSPSPSPNKNTEGSAKPSRFVFVKPLPHEVESYSRSIGYPMNGQAWCDSYEQKGWMVGKNKMKDWKAAVRNWKSQGWLPTEKPTARTTPDRNNFATDDYTNLQT